MGIIEWGTVGAAIDPPPSRPDDLPPIVLDASGLTAEQAAAQTAGVEAMARVEESAGDNKNVYITPESLTFATVAGPAGAACGIVAVLVGIDGQWGRVLLASIVAVVVGIFFYKLSIARASDKAKAKKDFKLVSLGVAVVNTVLLASSITGVVSLFPDGDNDPPETPPAVTTTQP